MNPDPIQVDVSLSTITIGRDPEIPLEVGFYVSVDISNQHPRFHEILNFVVGLRGRPIAVSDAQKILSMLGA